MNAQKAPQNLPHGYVWPLKFLHCDISTHHHLEQPGIFRISVTCLYVVSWLCNPEECEKTRALAKGLHVQDPEMSQPEGAT